MQTTEWRPMRGHPKMRLGLELITKILPPDSIGIEIGSYAGESAEVFAASGKFKTLFCIDPWDPNYYSGQQLISAEKHFDEIAQKYPCIRKMKGTSDQVLKGSIISSVKVDFIYIDGNHKYDFVKSDIINSLNVLKKFGGKYLAGHDYNYKKSPDVKKVIDELLEYPDAIFCDYSWLKVIK